jgi:hypothetical protein
VFVEHWSPTANAYQYESAYKFVASSSDIPYVYVSADDLFEHRKGLAEEVLRKRLVKQGWRVWKSNYIPSARKPDVYPAVKRAYEELCILLDKHRPGMREHIEYLSRVHHGLPDFICFRHGQFKFVECKLEYEGLLLSQKYCIPKLRELGFEVEVHKLVDRKTKAITAVIDINTGEKKITEMQLTISAAQRRASKSSKKQQTLPQPHLSDRE